MAVKLKDLMSKTRSIAVPFMDETVNVTYRVNVVTPTLVEQVRELPYEAGVRAQLEKAVVTWDVLGEDGQPLPPTQETLQQLPIGFNSVVLRAIAEDMSAHAAELREAKPVQE